MFALVFVFPLLCAPFISSQSHTSRALTSTDRGHDSFGPSSFTNKLESRYIVNITCDPAFPRTNFIEISSSGYTRYPITGKEVTWFLKPQKLKKFNKNNMTIVLVQMADSSCNKADYVYGPSKQSPQNTVLVFTQGRSCSPMQIIQAGYKLFPANTFMFYHLSYDYTQSGHTAQIPADPHNLFVFVYSDRSHLESYVPMMRNRSCFLNALYIESTIDTLINKTSVLFVSISFIFLMLISLAWLVFYYIQRFRYIHAKERLSRRLMNAAKKALNHIPIKVLKPLDKDLPWQLDQCAVCIEPFKLCESVRVLPCRHYFHKSCIDPWLLEQRTCPLCKLCILKAYGLQVRGHRSSQMSLDQPTVSVSPEPRRSMLVMLPTETSQPSADESSLLQMAIDPPEVQYHNSHRHEVRLERAPSPSVTSDDETDDHVTRVPLVHHSANSGSAASSSQSSNGQTV